MDIRTDLESSDEFEGKFDVGIVFEFLVGSVQKDGENSIKGDAVHCQKGIGEGDDA